MHFFSRRPVDPPIIVEVQSFEKELDEFRASTKFFVTATLVSATSLYSNDPEWTPEGDEGPPPDPLQPWLEHTDNPAEQPVEMEKVPASSSLTHTGGPTPRFDQLTQSALKHAKGMDFYSIIKTASGANGTTGDYILSTEILQNKKGDGKCLSPVSIFLQ